MRVGWISAVKDRRVASFRYRVEAPAAGLVARGHQAELIDPSCIDDYDVVVFSKAYSERHLSLARSVKKRGGRVVFDICDNHFYNPYNLPRYREAREQIGEMLSIADRVVCSTPALADVLRDEVDHHVEPMVIGDVVERYNPQRRARTEGEPLRLTWFGSHGSPNAPSGMTDLLLIREQLEALAAKHPVMLTVCSNNREKYAEAIEPLKLDSRYVEWSLDDIPSVLAETDAAILPMDINPFTRCKTHNRLSMALYAGVPVVAAGIDSYREFSPYCTLDDWDSGLQALIDDPEEERRRALEVRPYVEERWTVEALAAQWEAALALPTSKSATNRLADVSLQGRLDAVARGAVTGWVRAPLQPSLQLQVVLECDGEPVSLAVANRQRDDLVAAGLPAACGFALPLPPQLVGSRVSNITVRVLDSTWVVGENPIMVGLDEAPSFAPIQSSAVPASLRDLLEPAGDQRWDVADDIAVQTRQLDELKRNRNTSRPVSAGARKRRGQPGSFRALLQTGSAANG